MFRIEIDFALALTLYPPCLAGLNESSLPLMEKAFAGFGRSKFPWIQFLYTCKYEDFDDSDKMGEIKVCRDKRVSDKFWLFNQTMIIQFNI